MSSSKPRNLFRGWNRHESYWDSQGMNENLQFLEGHVPLNIVGQFPATISAPREGDVKIRKSDGTYEIWHTGLNLQAPTWVSYPALQGLLGFDARTNKVWFNDGSVWKDQTEIGLATVSALTTAIANAITDHENAVNPHPQYATVDQLNNAIDALEDLHLVGWQSYNTTTNTLTAIMSDGTTVAVDLTALVNDAIATVPDATDTTKGVVRNATAAQVGEGIDNGAVSISPADLFGALTGITPNALKTAIRAVSQVFMANGKDTTVEGDGTAGTPFKVNIADATRTVKGVVQLVKASDFPAQQSSETLGVSPSYVKQATDQLATGLTASLTTALEIHGFDEGTATSANAVKNINITGAGATATQSGNVLTIDVPSSSGASVEVTTGTDVSDFDSPAPTDGNVFYRNSDTGELWFHDGTKWSVVADFQHFEQQTVVRTFAVTTAALTGIGFTATRTGRILVNHGVVIAASYTPAGNGVYGTILTINGLQESVGQYVASLNGVNNIRSENARIINVVAGDVIGLLAVAQSVSASTPNVEVTIQGSYIS